MKGKFFFGAKQRADLLKGMPPNKPLKPLPKVDSNLKPVSFRTTPTQPLATAPSPVKGDG